MGTATLPLLLTAEDVALWLAAPVVRVKRMARRGEIPCRSLPGGVLAFSEPELAAWLAALPRAVAAGDARTDPKAR